MKLGVITSLWAYAENLSIVESLKRISLLGIHHADILGILHGDPLKLSKIELSKISKSLSALNITVGSLIQLPPGNIASEDDNERRKCLEYVEAGIEMITYLGGKQLLFNGGKREFGVSYAKSWLNAVNFIKQASDIAQDRDIFITIEAEPYVYFLVNDLSSTLQMMKDVNHPYCKTVLDIGHMNLCREAPDTLGVIKPWTLRVHLSENDGILHANDILGTGTVDIGAYLKTLDMMNFEDTCKNYGMDMVVVMELGVLGDKIPDPDEYAKQSLYHILRIAPNLEL